MGFFHTVEWWWFGLTSVWFVAKTKKKKMIFANRCRIPPGTWNWDERFMAVRSSKRHDSISRATRTSFRKTKCKVSAGNTNYYDFKLLKFVCIKWLAIVSNCGCVRLMSSAKRNDRISDAHMFICECFAFHMRGFSLPVDMSRSSLSFRGPMQCAYNNVTYSFNLFDTQ